MATLAHYYVAFLEQFPMKHVNVQPGTPVDTNMSLIYLLRESMQSGALFKIGTEGEQLNKGRNFNIRKINAATS